MSRADLITRSRRVTEASDLIARYGTSVQRTHRAAYLARGRFSDVIALAGTILATVPQSAYALTI